MSITKLRTPQQRVFEMLRLARFEAADGRTVSLDYLRRTNEYIAFFFGSRASPATRRFYKVLRPVYMRIQERTKQNKKLLPIEFVYVPHDATSTDFEEFSNSMPWPRMAFESVRSAQDLTMLLEVKAIPQVIVVSADDGTIVASHARYVIERDPEGRLYPWKEHSDMIVNEAMAEEKRNVRNRTWRFRALAIAGAALTIALPQWASPINWAALEAR